jgi:hypothetical protein
MFVTPLIWCCNQPFFNYFSSDFLDQLFLFVQRFLRTPIPTIFFLSFPTWGSHIHFVKIRYITRRPIRRKVVCSNSLSRSPPYSNNPPYLCCPFVGGWYTYSKSYIRRGFYFFTIVRGIFNIGDFSAANEVCSLISTGVGPLYIISSWLSYFQLKFSYFGCTDGI